MADKDTAGDLAEKVYNDGDIRNQDLTSTVAKHYNQLQESGLEVRKESRIFFVRNFNNWMKSMLIGDFIQRIKENNATDYPITVLDLCSGKGGDLLKWKKGGITKLVCADIAGTSVEQSQSRFKEMIERGRRDRYPQKMFSAEFVTADCTKERLKSLYKDRNIAFDMTSCQFSFHYSFESPDQAEMMLRNACECLKPGGYFIGTTPNCYEIVRRLQESGGSSFGNEVYRITFPDSVDINNLSLFGCKYNFHLEEVVDCPEFVVYFPLLEKMAKEFNMKLVYKKAFAEYFDEMSKQIEGRSLLGKMTALECYPADEGVELVGKAADAYKTTSRKWDELDKRAQEEADKDQRQKRNVKVGTLSQPEWEATTIYLVFAFQKMSSSSSHRNESLGSGS